MGRKSTFDDRHVFAALGRLLAEHGQATIADVRDATGLTTGSLYHRFGSREGLMAAAWLDTVEAFQERFVAALDGKGIAAGVEAALTTPRFCRDEPDLALVLVCCRPSEFLAEDTPAALRQRVDGINKRTEVALARYAARIHRPHLACRLALVGFPLGAVRLYLPRQRVPVSVDSVISKAVEATLS